MISLKNNLLVTRNFWLLLSVCWLWTCSGGGDKATGPEEPPIVINLTSLGGQAQRGYVIVGQTGSYGPVSTTTNRSGHMYLIKIDSEGNQEF